MQEELSGVLNKSISIIEALALSRSTYARKAMVSELLRKVQLREVKKNVLLLKDF